LEDIGTDVLQASVLYAPKMRLRDIGFHIGKTRKHNLVGLRVRPMQNRLLLRGGEEDRITASAVHLPSIGTDTPSKKKQLHT
jgi:hypothetical protein